jgi:hypothetical protein
LYDIIGYIVLYAGVIIQLILILGEKGNSGPTTSATPNSDQGHSHMKQHYSKPYTVPRLSIVKVIWMRCMMMALHTLLLALSLCHDLFHDLVVLLIFITLSFRLIGRKILRRDLTNSLSRPLSVGFGLKFSRNILDVLILKDTCTVPHVLL